METQTKLCMYSFFPRLVGTRAYPTPPKNTSTRFFQGNFLLFWSAFCVRVRVSPFEEKAKATSNCGMLLHWHAESQIAENFSISFSFHVK